VGIRIIALLIGILLPALGKAREAARDSVSISQVRQIGSLAMQNFVLSENGLYPWMSSSVNKISGTKPRWADYLYPWIENTDVFINPHLDRWESILQKKWWHEVCTARAHMAAEQAASGGNSDFSAWATDKPEDELTLYGGYGYNYQYLGNS
jgi:hypothetical protein